MAAERRQAKPRQSPPQRGSYGGYGGGRDSRSRSRSPMHGRDGRESRDGRELREPNREPGGQPCDHDSHYRGSESREKDPRGEPRGDPHPRDPAYRDEYDRYYRSGSAADDYYPKKDDRYRDPWNGRREPEDDRLRPEERRRNELYRQYYEELQRRYDADRPVDCSVIVMNKAQKEYAETVGRKVRDLGMVVDLIFLNTEVSLIEALEDVDRARTPFAIIVTQQHQVHCSCTVNILFGTSEEHRNMPIQDAMVLVAHNYDAYKVEYSEKEHEEIARKAAKMANDVLLREPDRESHPISLLTTITLLSENRFVTPEELDSLIIYLKDKRDRLVRSSGDPHAASHHEVQPKAPGLPPPPHSAQAAPKPSQVALPPVSNPPPNPSQQQELQAKILSLFNSGAGGGASASTASTASPSMAPQSQGYGSSMGGGMPQSSSHPPPSQAPPMMGTRPPIPPAGPPAGAPQGYGMLSGRMPAALGSQRPPSLASGINFDNPSVQKALDTLIQSGPSLNQTVPAKTTLDRDLDCPSPATVPDPGPPPPPPYQNQPNRTLMTSDPARLYPLQDGLNLCIAPDTNTLQEMLPFARLAEKLECQSQDRDGNKQRNLQEHLQMAEIQTYEHGIYQRGRATNGGSRGVTRRGNNRTQSNNGKPKPCFNCGKPGHWARDCPHLREGCRNCGKRDHWQRECPDQRKQKGERRCNPYAEDGPVANPYAEDGPVAYPWESV